MLHLGNIEVAGGQEDEADMAQVGRAEASPVLPSRMPPSHPPSLYAAIAVYRMRRVREPVRLRVQAARAALPGRHATLSGGGR